MIDKFQGQYRFLSNFYPSPIVWESILYPTVEHAYQASKTLDENEKLDIANLVMPGAAKRRGRHVSLRPDWEQVKLKIMFQLLRLKFAKSPLRNWLLATAPKELIEGNDWGDVYWGRCQGIGQNKLGLLLMDVREAIQNEEAEEAETFS